MFGRVEELNGLVVDGGSIGGVVVGFVRGADDVGRSPLFRPADDQRGLLLWTSSCNVVLLRRGDEPVEIDFSRWQRYVGTVRTCRKSTSGMIPYGGARGSS